MTDGCRHLSSAIYDRILDGRYSLNSFTSGDRAIFVGYGFARHKRNASGRDTLFDEPLAILAALQWVNKIVKFSLFECLRHGGKRHSNRKNGFEAYLAFKYSRRRPDLLQYSPFGKILPVGQIFLGSILSL